MRRRGFVGFSPRAAGGATLSRSHQDRRAMGITGREFGLVCFLGKPLMEKSYEMGLRGRLQRYSRY